MSKKVKVVWIWFLMWWVAYIASILCIVLFLPRDFLDTGRAMGVILGVMGIETCCLVAGAWLEGLGGKREAKKIRRTPHE